MPVADAPAGPTPIGELTARLCALGIDGIPLLVFRIPSLERTAWRSGMRAARAIERRASAAFASAAVRVLRGADLIAHDRGSDTFVAALVAPMRDGQRAVVPVDIRSALARIATAIEGRTRLDVDPGWTRFDASTMSMDDGIARALLRGAQERERYAFFSAMGHELRTPLASIRGYLETLLGDDVDDATRRRFTGIAYNETLRLARLLEGMFEISLLDLTAAFPVSGEGALDIALAGVADACAAAARSRAVTLHIAPVGPTRVAIDTEHLMLALINLVDNAIKHGRAGGHVRIDVDVRQARQVTLDIDDDGPGIAAAQRDRVFGLGERGTTTSPGNGIGLALVRLILERAGGRVEAGESPAGGARFSVALPRPAASGAVQADIARARADLQA